MLRRALVAAVLTAAAFAQDLAVRMDKVVQPYVARREFMGSVLVARGPEVLFSRGYGSANLEWGIPDAPNTKFRLGSVTKEFTAASILLLVEQGKLAITDPVSKYVPDSPPAWAKITLFHLLTHTSGIPNFTSFPDYNSTKGLPSPVEKTVGRFRDKPLDFPPGEKWNYSNSGYVLLGYILEKVSGQEYGKFVRRNIFLPLGMKDSGYDSGAAIIERRASGYVPGFLLPSNADYIDMSVPHAASGLYSTTGDLLRWENGLFGGKLLSAASLEKMTTPFKNDYAFGLAVHTVKGHKVIEHGGGIDGFNTQLAYYPEDKLTVVVLGNLNGAAPGKIAGELADLVHVPAVR